MDKLKPVLKHIFWICFGVCFLLILTGWILSKGNLAAAVEAGTTKVEQHFKDAKQPAPGVIPNQKWTDKASDVNAAEDQKYSRSAGMLRERQLSARTFPKDVAADLSRVGYGKLIRDPAVRGQFGAVYQDYLRSQISVIRPIVDGTGQGVVQTKGAVITQEDPTKWTNRNPTSKEIWHALEDIWLLRSVLDSIAAVNEGSDLIKDAGIRQLHELTLRGGDPEYEPGASGGGDGGFGGMMPTGSGGYDGGYDGGGLGMGGMGGGANNKPWARFMGSFGTDMLSEEFGSAGGASAFGGSGGNDSALDMGGMMGGMMGGGTAAVQQDRYVHDNDDKTLMYKTRAFLLHVRILEDQIPALLAELTDSAFPVEIVRVEARFGINAGSAGGGGRMMSGMGGGYGGEAGYDGGEGLSGGGGMPSMGMASGGGGSSFGGSMPSFGSGMPGMGGSSPSFGSGMPGMGGGGMPGMGGLSGGAGAGRAGGIDGSEPRRPLTNEDKKRMRGMRGLVEDALAHPALAELRIAGLMTLYESVEEAQAAEASEGAEASESEGPSTVPPATENGTGTETDDSADAAPGDAPGDAAATENEDPTDTGAAVPEPAGESPEGSEDTGATEDPAGQPSTEDSPETPADGQ